MQPGVLPLTPNLASLSATIFILAVLTAIIFAAVLARNLAWKTRFIGGTVKPQLARISGRIFTLIRGNLRTTSGGREAGCINED